MEYIPDRYQNPLLRDDIGYQETEELLFDLTAEIESVYGIAYEEMLVKCRKYLEWFTILDTAKRKLLDEGKITDEEYKQWRNSKMFTGRQNYAMLETLSNDLVNANMIAASIINGYMPEVYAINGNYIEYKISSDLNINLAFTLFDEQTVEMLVQKKPDLLPKAAVNIPIDKRWNKQKLTSAIAQGILQGETTDEIAKRLAAVTDMNKNSAIRNASTMTTSAQNAGRVEGAKRAERMGVQLEGTWIATLDGLTRASHRHVDGERRKVGQKFSNGLLYPGDPQGKPEEVYNCRCAYAVIVKGADVSLEDRENRLDGMPYEQWKNSKGGEPLFKAARNANRDYDMHEEYMDLLGKRVPSTLKGFQDLKYKNPEAWKKMVSDARKARNARRKKSG